MIVGQFTHKLLDRINQDINWETVSISYDMLAVINIINKKVLAQKEYQYPLKNLYEQELSVYGFYQNTLTKNQWYEKFNIKVVIRNTIRVTR